MGKLLKSLGQPGSLGYGARGAIRNLAAALALTLGLSGGAFAEPVTIAALGDSLTQGYGLPQQDGFVPQLQDWLRAQGDDVIVINAGVSGDTTAGGLARIDWTLTPDVQALIVALGGNDLLRGIPPEASRANLDGILARATRDGLPVLLVGLPAPGNYGPEFKAAFDAMYPELAAKYGIEVVPSFLGALEARGDRAATIREFMQSDGIHPNREGVALIVEDIGPRVARLVEAAR